MSYIINHDTFAFAVGGIGDLQQVLMPDSRRISVIFNPVQTSGWYYGITEMATLEDSVFSGTISVPTIVMYKDHGDLVKREWFAACNGAGGILAVTEILYQP
jgi:hypothetical protein